VVELEVVELEVEVEEMEEVGEVVEVVEVVEVGEEVVVVVVVEVGEVEEVVVVVVVGEVVEMEVVVVVVVGEVVEVEVVVVVVVVVVVGVVEMEVEWSSLRIAIPYPRRNVPPKRPETSRCKRQSTSGPAHKITKNLDVQRISYFEIAYRYGNWFGNPRVPPRTTQRAPTHGMRTYPLRGAGRKRAE
jgi:hypothetical protein